MSGEPSQSFGVLLLHFRRAAGLTQQELAERARLSADTISDLERGRYLAPRKTTVALLADALDLSPADRQQFESSIRRLRAGTMAHASIPFSTPLPLPITRLIGRDHEEQALARLLLEDHARLVTLTGTAGIGKTRLALAVAAHLAPQFADGVYFVPLAALQDWHLIPAMIAQALKIQEEQQQSLWDLITAYLGDKAVLLILDNLEHLLEGAAFVADLLMVCPQLAILVTSRAALRVRGERRFLVPPLVYAADAASGRSAAEELFVERAREVQPMLSLTPANVESIAAICRRLEGIPLAIELAAMRIATFSPPDLLRHLDHQLSLLVAGPRDLPQRQQTMRDAVAWSYDLLSSPEQAMFRRLAIFAGGWTLAAAQAICGEIEGANLLMALAALVDANLIRVDLADDIDEPRYAMLEIMREYGVEQLAARGEMEHTQRSHAEYMLALAQDASHTLKSAEQAKWLFLLEQEQGNLRAALHWAREYDAILGLCMTIKLWRFWFTRGYFSEGRAWLETFFAQTDRHDDYLSMRADACNLISVFAAQQADLGHAERFAAISVQLYDEVGDMAGKSSGLSTLGNLAYMRDHYERAEDLYRRALALGRASGDRGRIALSQTNLATALVAQGSYHEAKMLLEESLTLLGDQASPISIAIIKISLSDLAFKEGSYGRAIACAEEAQRLAEQFGDRRMIASSLDHIGKAVAGQGHYQQARDALVQSLQLYNELQDKFGSATVLRHMGDIACGQSEWKQAKNYYHDSIEIFQQIGTALGIAKCLAGWADVLRAHGQEKQAICCISKALSMCDDLNISPQARISKRLQQAQRAIQEALGEEAFQTAWGQGKTMSIADLLDKSTKR